MGLDAKWTVSWLKEAAIIACIFLLCSRRLWRLLMKLHYARLDFLKMFTVQSYRRMCMKDSLFSMVVSSKKFLSVQCACSSEGVSDSCLWPSKCEFFSLHNETIGTLLRDYREDHVVPMYIVGSSWPCEMSKFFLVQFILRNVTQLLFLLFLRLFYLVWRMVLTRHLILRVKNYFLAFQKGTHKY